MGHSLEIWMYFIFYTSFSDVFVAVNRTCGVMSREDGCVEQGTIDSSGWLMRMTCTCKGSKCNYKCGAYGFPYTASLTMICVVMAVVAFSSWPFNRQIIQFECLPTWSCVSLTRSTTSSEWKLFRFDKMEVNCFQILLIVVPFYI